MFVMAGLVPAIPIPVTALYPKNRDTRHIGELSDAVLQTAMPGMTWMGKHELPRMPYGISALLNSRMLLRIMSM